MEYIDKEEKKIIDSYENDEWVSMNKNKQDSYKKAAQKSSLKSKRINIRLTEKDYQDIQVKAMEEGIPYQTLISSIIHKYVKGDLKQS